jgi:hypothetical protein
MSTWEKRLSPKIRDDANMLGQLEKENQACAAQSANGHRFNERPVSRRLFSSQKAAETLRLTTPLFS